MRNALARKYGAYLVDLADELDQHWTPLRIVSQSEIATIGDRACDEYSKYSPQDRTRFDHVPVITLNTGRCDYFINQEGCYRVEPTTQESLAFQSVCVGGIPFHHSNAVYQEFFEHIMHKESAAAIDKRQRAIDDYWMEIKRKEVISKPLARDAQQFFRAIAMAGSVERA